jgi:hypothetical protein
MFMRKAIAERKLFYTAKHSSVKMELVIRIGTPYLDKDGMAKCPVQWDGLFEDFADLCGMDLLQALQLAANVDSMLQELRNKYDFFWTSGEPYFDD